jgi:hypothetical protein
MRLPQASGKRDKLTSVWPVRLGLGTLFTLVKIDE